jgi:hypothetical protein
VELSDDRIAYLAPSVFASQPVAGVSERYTFLPTSQILARMRSEGWTPVEARQQTVRVDNRIGYQKHMLRFQRSELIAKAGEFTPELVLTNSHDRSSAYVLSAGLWRFVCSNGLMVADSTLESVHIRHSGQEADQVIEASFSMFAQLDRVADSVARFQSWTMSEDEQRQFAERAIALRWPENAPIRPEKVLAPRRTEDTGNNLWVVYNRTHENLLQGGQRDYLVRRPDGGRFARTREVKGLDEGIRLNRGLWEIASSFLAN